MHAPQRLSGSPAVTGVTDVTYARARPAISLLLKHASAYAAIGGGLETEREMSPTIRASAVSVAFVGWSRWRRRPLPIRWTRYLGTASLSSGLTLRRASTERPVCVDVRGLDKQCADPGLDVRVVHVQHA